MENSLLVQSEDQGLGPRDISAMIAMLDYPDSMASRLARRLDVEPAVLARRLSEL